MKNIENSKPPQSYEDLINLIVGIFPEMNRGYQKITRYMVQNPNSIGIESVKVIAKNAEVQPSSLVRFAKEIGFSGFSEMKKIFQSHLITNATSRERLDSLNDKIASKKDKTPSSFLETLVKNDINALQEMLQAIPHKTMEKAVSLMLNAKSINVIGQLRSFPIANYIRYALVYLRQDVRLLEGAGGLATEQAEQMDKNSVLIAISFRYYAREVVDIVKKTWEKNIPIITITDSQLSPLSKLATCDFIIKGGSMKFSYSLAAPMCLAQSMIINMASRIQLEELDEELKPSDLLGNKESKNLRKIHSAKPYHFEKE